MIIFLLDLREGLKFKENPEEKVKRNDNTVNSINSIINMSLIYLKLFIILKLR